MNRISSVLLCAVIFIYGCKTDNEQKCTFVPDVSDIQIELKMESLEDSLPSIVTKTQLVTFLTNHPALRDHFFGRSAYPNDSVFINQLFHRFTDLSMDTLLADTHRVFGDGSELREQFKSTFANIKYYYPYFKIPHIQTMISGMETDLIVSDTLIVVGLDYFLGADARYRPNMYDYMLRRYKKDFIVPSVLLLYGIDNKFNKTDLADKTVLADMVAYGKAFYFAKHMMPCLPDSVFIGYTTDDVNSINENEDLIYGKLIENEVIYSTSHQIKQRYLAERPKTLEIGERCPGRIGQWIGWRIVDAYSDKSDDKVPSVMATSSAARIFKESRYRPGKR